MLHQETGDSWQLWVWQSEEQAFEALEATLSSAESKKLQEIKADSRRQEFLSFRQLLRAIPFDEEITYMPNGKPQIGSGHISISHTSGLVALLIGTNPVGLDLQAPAQKLYRVRSKFCHADELSAAQESEDEMAYLCLLWSAKEAVFKIYGEQMIFSEDMVCLPFDPLGQAAIICKTRRHGRIFEYILERRKLGDSYLVFSSGDRRGI